MLFVLCRLLAADCQHGHGWSHGMVAAQHKYQAPKLQLRLVAAGMKTCAVEAARNSEGSLNGPCGVASRSLCASSLSSDTAKGVMQARDRYSTKLLTNAGRITPHVPAGQ